MVRVVPVPEGEIIIGSYPDAAQVVGMVSRVAIAAGEMITSSKVGPTENSACLGCVRSACGPCHSISSRWRTANEFALVTGWTFWSQMTAQER